MRILRVAAVALGVSVAVAGCGRETAEAPGGLVPFPAPAPVPVATASRTDFAGSEACAPCHAEQYRAWATSTHGTAGGEPGPNVVIAPFDGTPISRGSVRARTSSSCARSISPSRCSGWSGSSGAATCAAGERRAS